MKEDEALRIAELEADNARLRQLLDQRDAPGELRHRLRSTLYMLRSTIRKSAEKRRNLSSYVAHLEDRLEALTRAQSAADETGGVDLHSMVAGELLYYHASEEDQFTLSGPQIRFQPRAGQIFAMAVHELAVNAVEHGALGSDSGHIDVAWTVEAKDAGNDFRFVWRETGGRRARSGSLGTAVTPQGFGAEVLTQTVRYELEAETVFDFSPGEFKYTAQFPLTDRIGLLAPSSF